MQKPAIQAKFKEKKKILSSKIDISPFFLFFFLFLLSLLLLSSSSSSSFLFSPSLSFSFFFRFYRSSSCFSLLSFFPFYFFIFLFYSSFFFSPSFISMMIALISHTSKVLLKILKARLQQYMNRELSDVQAGFRKGRGTRDQIANILLDHGKNKRVPEKHLFLLY